METLNLTKNQFEHLNPINLNSLVTNTESVLFANYTYGGCYLNPEIIKKFRCPEGKIFNSKMTIIKQLIEKSVLLPPELVLPKRLFMIDNNLYGYTMDYIYNNQNLSEILASNIPLSQKLFYLKQVLNIIKKLEFITCFDTPVYLGDIHEGNFIYDLNKNMIRSVDVDSIVFNQAYSSASRYLSFNQCTGFFKYKYPRGEFDNPVSNHNSSYLCFIYMLLNTISEYKIYTLTLDKFYQYLEHLKIIGISTEVIEALATVFSNNENYFHKEYLNAFLQVPREKLLYHNLSAKY